jgi:hypothetical protein
MRYYCSHGSYSQTKANDCRDCVKRARVEIQGPMRACGDCAEYASAKNMIGKPDGRVICPACQRAIDAKERERAQGNMFVMQLALF